MAKRARASVEGKVHRFGGDWTSTKLEVLEKYLAAYTTALKASPFRKAYIDAFAGTGYRTMKEAPATGESSTKLLFPELAATEPQELLDGSARLALKVEPRFDRYVFIERDEARCRQLEALRDEFPQLKADIRVAQGEANAEIRALCAKDWSRHRAVLFLDPYGMQVEWSTIEAIARTCAIDLWLLFPLGMGVNRLLTRSGDIPAGWRARLDTFLGTTTWHDELYSVDTDEDLFGVPQERVVKATLDTIARYCNDRLKTVFPIVAEPGVLRNSSNNPLYLLCFAAGNERGGKIALKIANHLLKDVR